MSQLERTLGSEREVNTNMAKAKAKSYQPIWGDPGEAQQTCEHRFGSIEECNKYAAKRMLDEAKTLCGAIESQDEVNAKFNDELGDAESFARA